MMSKWSIILWTFFWAGSGPQEGLFQPKVTCSGWKFSSENEF
jgi:hypothetical protein